MARTLLASRFGLSIENAPLRAVYVAVCVLALVAGVLLLVYPKEASDALAVVAGISLVIGGMQNVVFYFANALAAKTNKPAASDPIESVDFEDKTGE